MIELTVLWEDGCEEASDKKATKYQDHVQQCRNKGWKACFQLRLVAGVSLHKALGMEEREMKTATHRLGEAAERPSCWLWNRPEELSWKPGEDGP